MTDLYDKVRDDAEFRSFTAEQVGLGFTPPQARKASAADVPRCSPEEKLVTA
jgi:hypothetical protein